MSGRPSFLRAKCGKRKSCNYGNQQEKIEEGLGRGRKKDDRGGFIVFRISVSVKRKFLIGRRLVNPSTKSSISKSQSI